MTDIDLHKEYDSTGECIQDLFDNAGEGFFVPLYQREYTWEEENINQLFDDLVLGARELSEDDKATTFLGTTILTTHGKKKETVMVGEERAQPTAVQIVIDGQQRISTLALISIQIIVKLRDLLNGLPPKPPYLDLRNAGEGFTEDLQKLHSIELRKGAQPPQKPKIIRGQKDRWTYKGDDSAYHSPVAHYIATYIRRKDAKIALAALDSESGTRVRGNVVLINEWLDWVCNAHISGTSLYDQFPVGKNITSPRLQEYVLGFEDEDGGVKEVVDKCEADRAQNNYWAAATYQLLLLTYYLLRRCGVNCLQPTHEEWGFDMFQALNATGTPLTVMETFLPQVMQAEAAMGNDWDKTPSCEYMDEIRELFEVTTTNEQKNRRTNELLSTFALCYEGEKLGNKFSGQRRWMTRVYEKQLSEIDEKREFMRKLARTASFYYFAWYMEESAVPYRINGLETHPEGEFASLLVRYLRSANSRLSAPILARFYSQAVDGEATFDEFIEGAKACAAFFTLWRSANSTSGLDDIYRRYFKGGNTPVVVGEHNLKRHPQPASSASLKKYFLDVLTDRGIVDQQSWIKASERFLLYTELKTICRFILFIASHDRIIDIKNPGLTEQGKKGSCTLLNLGRWMAKDFKSLEHVAPQNPPAGHKWDPDIYAKNLVHEVGNMMLLPLDINKIVDNKDWVVKYLHYCHVGERSQAALDKLEDEARQKGIVLSKRATDALSKAEYNCAVEPVLSVGESGAWNADLITDRTRQIKELAWATMFSWLQP